MRINEIHYTDTYTPRFELWRKKYLKWMKEHPNDKLYVQFTNFNTDKLERNPYQKPDHNDPIGVYAYPIEYVLKHPSDVWYGSNTNYLRVLRDKSKNKLDIQLVSETDIYNLFSKVYSDDEIRYAIRNAKKHIETPRTWPKIFMWMVQNDINVLPNKVQTELLLKFGFDAFEDTAKTNKKAAVNAREPEQICFLSRYSFEVVETVFLSGSKNDNFIVFNDPKENERKLVAFIAHIMDDKLLSEKPERANLMGWSYYWTKKGRRIEVNFERDDSYYKNLSFGEKPHRKDKLSNQFNTFVSIKSEIGEMKAKKFDKAIKFKDILKYVKDWWETNKIQDNKTDWVPENKKSFEEKQNAIRQEQLNKRRKKEYEENLATIPSFVSEIRQIGEYVNLPFSTYKPELLIPILLTTQQLIALIQEGKSFKDAFNEWILYVDSPESKPAALEFAKIVAKSVDVLKKHGISIRPWWFRLVHDMERVHNENI